MRDFEKRPSNDPMTFSKEFAYNGMKGNLYSVMLQRNIKKSVYSKRAFLVYSRKMIEGKPIIQKGGIP